MLKFSKFIVASLIAAAVLAPPKKAYAAIGVPGQAAGVSTILPQDANGWTILTPTTGTGTCSDSSGTYTGSCIYYISNTGNDGGATCKGYAPPITDTPATTCATIAGAINKSRLHKPDFILLKRGETVLPTVGTGTQLFSRGESAAKPLVISSYGASTDKPLINFKNYTDSLSYIFLYFSSKQYVVVEGLKFTNSLLDPTSPDFDVRTAAADTFPLQAVVSTSALGYLHIENVETDWVGSASVVSDAGTFVFRRNVVGPTYSYANTADSPLPVTGWNHRNNFASNGLYSAGIRSQTVEENLFYKTSTYPELMTGGTVTIDIPSSTLTWTDTGQPPAGQPPNGAIVAIGSTGTLPTGITKATSACHVQQCYYLVNSDYVNHTAQISRTKGGTAITFSGSQSGIHTVYWVDPEGNPYNHNQYADIGWDNSSLPVSVRGISGPMIWRWNITSYASNSALQGRPGGLVFDNLFLKNPTSLVGASNKSDYSYNVIMYGTDFQYAMSPGPLGWAISMSSFTCTTPVTTVCPTNWAVPGHLPVPGSDGSRISHNIVAHLETSGNNGKGIELSASGDTGLDFTAPATHDITVEQNVICDWKAASGNAIQDNGSGNHIGTNYFTTSGQTACDQVLPSALDVTRDPASYYVDVLGGPPGSTVEDFILAAKATWNKQNWDSRYGAAAVNAYIREGFGIPNP